MAQTTNPFMAPAGQFSGIAEGITNLGQAFLQGSDPVRMAQAEQAAFAAKESQEAVREAIRQRQLLESNQQLVSGADLTNPANFQTMAQQLVANTAGSGENFQNIGDLLLATGGISPGVDTSGMGRLFAGSGRALGENQGLGIEDREQVAARNIRADQQLQAMRDAAAAQRNNARIAAANSRAAASRRVAAANAARGSQGTMQAVQYQLPDGSTVQGMFNNRAGFMDAQGNPMDMSQVSNVARIGTPTGSNQEIGFDPTTSTTSSVQKQQIADENLIADIDRISQTATPTNMGTPGAITRGLSSLTETARGLGQLFGVETGAAPPLSSEVGDFEAAKADIIADAQQLAAEQEAQGGYVPSILNDPSADEMEMLATSINYRLAAANKAGGKVSNDDVERQERSTGLTGALANPASARARLGVAREQAVKRLERAAQLTGGTPSGEMPQQLAELPPIPQGRPIVPQGESLGDVILQDLPGGQPPAGIAAPAAAAPAPAAPAPTGPQPGDVEDGFRFLGGDPADPNSWEAL